MYKTRWMDWPAGLAIRLCGAVFFSLALGRTRTNEVDCCLQVVVLLVLVVKGGER